MDEADRAQQHEEAERDAALAITLARIAAALEPRNPNASGLCVDCDEPIEPERLAALRRTARCAQCARDFEQRMKGIAQR